MDENNEIQREREAAKQEGQKNARDLEDLAQQLREAAPKSPVEKMRATKLMNTIGLGNGSPRYTVDMLLELSEAERALVLEHQLDFIEIENVSRYTEEQLAQMRYDRRKELDAISEVRNPMMKAITLYFDVSTPIASAAI